MTPRGKKRRIPSPRIPVSNPSSPSSRWLPGAGVLAVGLALGGWSLWRSPVPDEPARSAAPEPAAWAAPGPEDPAGSRVPSSRNTSPLPNAGKVMDRKSPPPPGTPGAGPPSLVESIRASGMGASSQKGPGLPTRHRKLAPGEDGWREQAVFDADADPDAAASLEALIEEAGLAAADPTGDHAALLGRLRDALAVEKDDEIGQDLLNAAADLAARDAAALAEVLATALAPSRPVEIRRAALYLAAGHRNLLESIASDPAHDLRTDAAALMLDQDRAAGRIEPPRDTPVEEQ